MIIIEQKVVNINNNQCYFLSENNFKSDPRSPIQFLPVEEVFVKVTPLIVPDVKDYYWISNYGNLYSTFKDGLIQPGIDTKGYYYAALATNKGPKNMRIHRLVMMAFCYFPGCENEIINHCDGIKTHCWVWNLEWSNFSANAQHSYDMGLHGRVHSTRTLSDEDVIKISNLLIENKLTCTDLARLFNTSTDMIYSIKHKRAYTNLTESYNFPSTKYIYDENCIENICLALSTIKPEKPLDELNITQKHHYYQQIIKATNIENSPRSVDLIKRIYRRQSFTEISNKYNF